nr:hypothetical protein [Belnapia arida]
MQIGGMDVSEEDQADRIDENVPLPAEDPLRGFVAARWPAATNGPHSLAVDDGGRWLGLLPLGFARESAQAVMRALQRAVEPSAAEVREHCLPRREGGRQHPPGAAEMAM